MADLAERVLHDIRSHETPLERARTATEYLALLQQAQRQIALQRLRDVDEVRATTSMTIRALAAELGVTKTAILQVMDEHRARPRRRRAAPDA